jgi:hypothetical protein
MPDPLHDIGNFGTALRPQSNRSATVEVSRQYLAMQTKAVALEEHAGAWFQFLTRMHQTFPGFASVKELGVVPGEFAKQKTLDGTPARNAAPNQARWKHTSVVEHEQVARVQMFS